MARGTKHHHKVRRVYTRTRRPSVHRYIDDPKAPGTCETCHIPDNPEAPRNEAHNLDAVAAAEAREEQFAEAVRDFEDQRLGEPSDYDEMG